MPVIFGQSQTVDLKTAVNTAGGYGSTILTSTSSTYALVGAVTFTFSNVIDGMKLYIDYQCTISASSSSVCSVIARVNDNGTTTDIAESECQSDLVGGVREAVGSATYTIAHCGTTGAGTAIVSLMGKRVIGSGSALVVNPIVLRARLARD